jgi:hypothetical protein
VIKGQLAAAEFSEAKLTQWFGRGPSISYLLSYLGFLRASAVLVEGHYIDRHYLDDFGNYYARSFDPPTADCARLHFFEGLSAPDLVSLLVRGFGSVDDRANLERLLGERYLGFVVRRPISGANIGRTVLKTYPADGRRHYGVVRPYRVNVAGLRFTINGLAYQQQDRGAAVCASTALWSALQRVAFVSGHRTPTPSAITAAAKSPFPASYGLDLGQMATALSNLGYAADYFVPGANRAEFRAKVVTCLASQLPVILLIERFVPLETDPDAGLERHGHAVTLTGYSDPPAIVDVPAPMKAWPPIRTRDASVRVVYVHDDNLGSHAHYELIDSEERNSDGHRKLILRRGRTEVAPPQPPDGSSGEARPPEPWWPVEDWTVFAALIPKPVKLRMSVEDCFSETRFVRHFAGAMFPGASLHFSAKFASAVEYKRSLLENGALHAPHMARFQMGTSWPRFIGVVSTFNDAGEHLCDVILDVSEVKAHPVQVRPHVLGIVAPGAPIGSPESARFELAAHHELKCPLILGPPKAIPVPALSAGAPPVPPPSP